jgi:hypothetical protein
MDYSTINLDAAEDALRLIGGDDLVAVSTVLYSATNAAEERGFDQGFQSGYDIGLMEGRREAELAVTAGGASAALAQEELAIATALGMRPTPDDALAKQAELAAVAHADEVAARQVGIDAAAGRVRAKVSLPHPQQQPSDKGLEGLARDFIF